MSNENMYFDPKAFDFTSLVDVVEHDEAPKGKPAPAREIVGPDGGATDDISDLYELFEDEADEEETEEADPNDDVTDLQTPEANPDVISLINDLPDDAALDIGGETMTKAQIKELKEAKAVFEDQKELINTAANSIEQIHRHIANNHIAHRLSIDTNIANIQRKMNSGISSAEYGEEARKLQQAFEAKAMLNNRVNEEIELLDIQAEELRRFRLLNMQTAMRSKIPEWDRIQGGLWNDLENRGYNLRELEKAITVPMAEDLLDAYRYRQQKKKAGEQAIAAAKAKAPRSTATAANANRQSPLDTKEAKKRALLKKQRNGTFTKKDNADMFEFLVD
ncbi:TPA: hypothetical protein JLH60_004754 [Escherichia coli]|nr:hypothetical protein [Escherichia coli]